MPEQTLQLQAAWYAISTISKGWSAPAGSRLPINADLRSFSRFFVSVYVRAAGSIVFHVGSSQTDSDVRADLTSEFEEHGSLELIVGANSLLVALDNADMAEPYEWTPSNSAEVTAFEAMLSGVNDTESGQLIIRDFVPTQQWITR